MRQLAEAWLQTKKCPKRDVLACGFLDCPCAEPIVGSMSDYPQHFYHELSDDEKDDILRFESETKFIDELANMDVISDDEAAIRTRELIFGDLDKRTGWDERTMGGSAQDNQ